MKQFALPPKRRRVLLVCLAGLLLAVCAYCFIGEEPRPLTPEEQLLVGEWSDGNSGITRGFHADRTISTSNRQYVGRWHIEDGKLKVVAWELFELPRSLSLSSIRLSWNSLQRHFEEEKYSWQIDFLDDGRTMTLNHPVDEQHPDGKWLWTKQMDR